MVGIRLCLLWHLILRAMLWLVLLVLVGMVLLLRLLLLLLLPLIEMVVGWRRVVCGASVDRVRGRLEQALSCCSPRRCRRMRNGSSSTCRSGHCAVDRHARF